MGRRPTPGASHSRRLRRGAPSPPAPPQTWWFLVGKDPHLLWKPSQKWAKTQLHWLLTRSHPTRASALSVPHQTWFHQGLTSVGISPEVAALQDLIFGSSSPEVVPPGLISISYSSDDIPPGPCLHWLFPRSCCTAGPHLLLLLLRSGSTRIHLHRLLPRSDPTRAHLHRPLPGSGPTRIHLHQLLTRSDPTRTHLHWLLLRSAPTRTHLHLLLPRSGPTWALPPSTPPPQEWSHQDHLHRLLRRHHPTGTPSPWRRGGSAPAGWWWRGCCLRGTGRAAPRGRCGTWRRHYGTGCCSATSSTPSCPAPSLPATSVPGPRCHRCDRGQIPTEGRGGWGGVGWWNCPRVG